MQIHVGMFKLAVNVENAKSKRWLHSLALAPIHVQTMTLLIPNDEKGSENVNANMKWLFRIRSESFGHYYPEADHNYTMLEKRQLFLRSYQFRRKQTLKDKLKGSLVRVKKVLWLRLRSAKKLKRIVFSRIKIRCRTRRFSRLLSAHNHNRKIDSSFSFWNRTTTHHSYQINN
ncbi:hypothetical protein VNO78_18226 [Psophocarpus tetragonolobus]|uniref:Uncharacterized protein n=1 Tax=Psophocarpus tetragonolobus TaxID=3891 RepID=A0AAN9SI20_PSOTE